MANGSPSRPSSTLVSHQAGGLGEELVAAQHAVAEAHAAFLRMSHESHQAQAKLLEYQMALYGAMSATSATTPPRSAASTVEVAFDRDQCLEFARGTIGKVLGDDFAGIDSHPTRVRLPDEPLMLVDRILSVSGERASLGAGALITEHDVKPGEWYLDNGRFAPGVCIEAGQADLFLSAYLGIDFQTRGEAVYRLLDAAVTYHRGLPSAGDVIRYAIQIERFIRQADTWMFFFTFEATIDGEPLMSMTQGCAGFFTKKQLSDGRGIVLAEEEMQSTDRANPPQGVEFVARVSESYGEEKLEKLRRGDLAGCFGPRFDALAIQTPLTIPGGRLRLLDRVTEMDPSGGRFGLGSIRAEIDIHPDDWFLTRHFRDDPVMPGTLMYESALQALRIFLLRMGWIGERGQVHFEPKPGIKSRLKCRGQVIPGTKKARYEVSIKKLGFDPEPHAIADVLMLADDHAIVEVTDVSLQLTGATREGLDELWRGRKTREHGVDERKPAIYDKKQIIAYGDGSLLTAFGEGYRHFDEEGRFIARLPREPYLFLDRITEVRAQPWVLAEDGWIEGQYDIPADGWYFRANRQDSLPFSVLLEFPLQCCGWFAAFMGSALTNKEDLHFRNLGGTATLLEDVTRGSGTLTARVRVRDISLSGGMILQEFSFDVTRAGKTVYKGETMFGFFTGEALAQQVGVRGAAPYEPKPDEIARGRRIELTDCAPLTPDDPAATPTSPLAPPARAYRFLDAIELYVPDGGQHGMGFLRGVKEVDPKEWFFEAHFYRDPVIPGSLGLESFLQLLKIVAVERWGGEIAETHRFEPIATGIEHTWVYRGQVLPTNRRVEVEAVIDAVDNATRTIKASGYLKVDGLAIYEMKNFAIRAVANENRSKNRAERP